MNRKEIIDFYKKNPEVPVLIVGAGVNGIGTFRDLALNNVDALLVDKGDFCSGGSAASSHMAHGGIRYLEYGEFRLVNEAVNERNRLIKNAPHYVKPLPTVIPIFKWFSGLFNAPFKFLGLLEKPSERGALVIKIGLIFYDAFTGRKRTVPRHQFFGKRKSFAEFPKLHPDIKFTARYYDGAMHTPERICVDLLLDAEAANSGARSLNYFELVRAEGNTVFLRDSISGEEITIKPKILINAAGAWIDFANRKMGRDTKFIGGTKGSHIIVENAELRDQLGENEFFFENNDGRITLFYPLEDKVMIGTTDLPIHDPEQAECTEEEVDYFLEFLPRIFPSIHVDRSQIVYKFSGVRPLTASDADNPGAVSRDHSIKHAPAGDDLDFPVLSLVGGKWTSFRYFSEEVARKTMDLLGLKHRISTKDLAIGGGKDYPGSNEERRLLIEKIAITGNLESARAAKLFERYGTRAVEIAENLKDEKLLQHLPSYSKQEVEYIAKVEKVVKLEDFFQRRSMLAILGQVNEAAIREVAGIIAPEAGWPDAPAEADNALTLFRTKHGMKV